MSYVPGWSAIEGLGGVVVAFTVTANEEKLVGNVGGGIVVQRIQDAVEALPLCQACCRRTVFAIGLVDQTKVDSGLFKRVSIAADKGASNHLRSQKCWPQCC